MQRQIALLLCFLCITLAQNASTAIQILSILPAQTTSSSNVLLQSRDAITVIFDSPVIALGSDWGSSIPSNLVPFTLVGANVPGHFRWVTTSIARFDPDMDWPSDLNFRIQILTSNWEGRSIASNGLSPQFVTNPATMFIVDVQSSAAQALTNNHWSSQTQRLDVDGNSQTVTSGFEVPPDGEIQVHFNTPIELDLVGSGLTIVASDQSRVPFTYKNCTSKSDDCIIVVPRANSLAVDEEYTLTFPAGLQTSQYSGRVGSALTQRFYGLYPFRIPFIQSMTSKLNAQTLNLYLRHGIQDSSKQAFIDAIYIEPSIAFQITFPDMYLAQITANFAPSVTYTIGAYSSDLVLDGFGLPLLASSGTFSTDVPSPLLLQAKGSDNIMFENFTGNWVVFSRDASGPCGQYTVDTVNINNANLINALATTVNYRNQIFVSTTSHPLPETTAVGNVDMTVFPTDTLFGTSGLWLNIERSCSGNSYIISSRLVSSSNLAQSVVSGDGRVTSWVTRTDANSVVTGATVSVYGFTSSTMWNSGFSPAAIQLYGSGTTDVNGLFSIDLPASSEARQGWVVVSQNGQLHVSNLIYFSNKMNPRTTNTPKVTIVTDRSFYNPGDTIYIKGYVRYETPDYKIVLPSETAVKLSIVWRSTDTEATSYTAALTDKGTFQTSVTVPTDAKYGTNSFTTSTTVSYYLQSVPILIASPRIPTTVLEINTLDKVYKPGHPVRLNMTLSTYTGQGIPGAPITLRWTLSRARPSYWLTGFYYGWGAVLPNPTTTSVPNESGETTVTTDDNGNVNDYSLILTLNNPAEEGNTLTITGEYYSPTKELLSVDKKLNVAYSELSLSLKPTVEGVILPGYDFGIFVATQDVTTSNQISGIPVNVTLYQWDNVMPTINRTTGVPMLAGHGTPIQNCSFLSVDGGTNIGCLFNLPNIGKYLLIASSIDGTGYQVTSVLPVGRNQTEWIAAPLSNLNGISMVLDKTSYSIPSTATVSFFNPFEQSKVLVRWGNSPQSKFSVSSESYGPTKITIPIGNECFGGCVLDLILTAPRSITGARLPVSVPTSVLYDPSAPVAIIKSLSISVPDTPKILNVSITLDQPVVAPGTTSGFTINLSKNGVPSSGEVAIFVVDKAVLDLVPHPTVDYASILAARNLAQYFVLSDDRDNLASLSGYRVSADTLRRRLRANPWVVPNWALYPDSDEDCINEIDMSDKDYFSIYTESITYFSSYTTLNTDNRCTARVLSFLMTADAAFSASGGAFPTNMAAALPKANGMETDAGGASPPPPAPTQASVTIRSKFMTTPLFVGQVLVNSSGTAHINWTLPDNIGTFEVRVYAIDDDNAFGSATANQITRRPFSLQSAAPRIVRNGDKFLSGVSITIHESNFDDFVNLEVDYVCQVLATLEPRSKIVRLSGPGPHLVNFAFEAIGTGQANILYKLTYNGALQDAANFTQDVRGQQIPVFIATSFAISADSSAREGYQLPPAVDFSGILTIDAGVGRLPAVQYFANIVKDRILSPYGIITSDTYLAAMISHLALSKYGFSEQNIFNLAMDTLPQYSSSGWGLQLFPISMYSAQYSNVELQAFGLLVLSEIQKMPSLSPTYQSRIATFTSEWSQAMTSSIVSQAAWYRSQGLIYSQFDTVAVVFLGAGLSWVPNPGTASPDVVQDLSLSRLLSNTDKLSAAGKAAIALALLRELPSNGTALSILSELTSTFRVQGRTAYITEPHAQNPSFTASALALSSYVITKQTNPLIEKLANFASLQDLAVIQGTFRYIYFSAIQASYLMKCLSEYDSWKGNTHPYLRFAVQSEQQVLLDANFTSPASPPAHVGLFFEDVENSSAINFYTSGTGEASVVFGATFVPLNLNLEPIYRGIQVQKVIQKLNLSTNLATGSPITTATVGEKVMVTIQITIPDYASSIVITDPFPGAIEPLDDNIYNTDSSPSPSLWMPRIMVTDYWSWYINNAFSTKEFQKDKVVFYGQRLYAGTHTVSYVALVNTEGEFVLPPAEAMDAFQPELMGLSAGGYFITKPMNASTVKISIDYNASYCLPWTARDLEREQLNIDQPSILENGNEENSPAPMPTVWIGALIGILLCIALFVVALVFIFRAYNRGTWPFSDIGGNSGVFNDKVKLASKSKDSDSSSE